MSSNSLQGKYIILQTVEDQSKHLLILEKADLVVTVWRGKEKLHYLNPVPLQSIYERWIRKYEGKRLEALDALKQVLERQKGEQ